MEALITNILLGEAETKEELTQLAIEEEVFYPWQD